MTNQVKNPLEYQIEILETGGATFAVYAVNEVLYWEDPAMKYSKDVFHLEEDLIFPYLYFFIKDHFDSSIQNREYGYFENDDEDDDWIEPEYDFDGWGENYYTYASIQMIIKEIKETLQLI